MYKLQQAGNKQAHVVHLGDKRLYFSYETLVGYYNGTDACFTRKKYSQTTTTHVQQFARNHKTRWVGQDELESIVDYEVGK